MEAKQNRGGGVGKKLLHKRSKTSLVKTNVFVSHPQLSDSKHKKRDGSAKGSLKPNLVRDIFERTLEALIRMHVYTRNDNGRCSHGRCCQFHVRWQEFERRSRLYSQALTC